MRSPHSLARAACLLTVAATIGLLGCGGGGGASSSSTAAATGTQAVTIKNFAFNPPSLTVAKGTTIDFTNHDSTSHTATSSTPGAFETGTIKPGKSASVTLEKPGTYSFYCAFHPFMKGTITVK